MSLTGKALKSHRKQDLLSQKSPAVGFKALRFAHKASAGDVGFSLNAMTVPTEMTALGFSQPTPAELQSANLQFYKKNLILASTARGLLQESLDFVVGANGKITFSDQFGTALQDEIFVGTIDPVARTGSLLADTVSILETGTLAADATDIPVGRAFATNTNSNYQVGAVSVYVGGQKLLRNVANATAAPAADGDYQEVDNGSGACNLIRLNNSDSSSRPYIVISNALSVVNPDGSLLEDLQHQQATIDKIVETLALVAGVPETDFQGSPSQPLLRQFGDRVVTLEQNRARIDLTNTWTAVQPLPGVTDGTAAADGYIGQQIISSSTSVSAALTTNTYADFISGGVLALTPGDWDISFQAFFSGTPTTTTQLVAIVGLAPGSSSSGIITLAASATNANPTATTDIVLSLAQHRISLTAATNYYLKVRWTGTGTGPGTYGRFSARRVR